MEHDSVLAMTSGPTVTGRTASDKRERSAFVLAVCFWKKHHGVTAALAALIAPGFARYGLVVQSRRRPAGREEVSAAPSPKECHERRRSVVLESDDRIRPIPADHIAVTAFFTPFLEDPKHRASGNCRGSAAAAFAAPGPPERR